MKIFAVASLGWENVINLIWFGNLIWLFDPLDMGPKLLHVVLYEYLSLFLNTTCKKFTLKEMKKKNIYGSKVALPREPSKNKKRLKKYRNNFFFKN